MCSVCYARAYVPISQYGASTVINRYQACPEILLNDAPYRYVLPVNINPQVDFDNYGFVVGTEHSLVAVGLLVNKAGYVNHLVFRTWRNTYTQTLAAAIAATFAATGISLQDTETIMREMTIQGENGDVYGETYCPSIGHYILSKCSNMPDGNGKQFLFFAAD